MTTTEFKVLKLDCASCSITIEGICEDVPGVKKAEVNSRNRTLKVEHDDTVQAAALQKALADEGYPIEPAA